MGRPRTAAPDDEPLDAVPWLAASRRPRGANPFANAPLYVEFDSLPRWTAHMWRATRPDDADAVEALAREPVATWMGDWCADVGAEAAALAERGRRQGRTVLLVAYALPGRDLAGYSAGGLTSADEYRAWVASLGAGIGDARAVVVLEPDALAQADGLHREAREERMALLAEAVEVLSEQPRTAVYLDAGHSAWKAAELMAERLEQAGVAKARGVSLNVSNFRATTEEVRYGRALGRALGRPLACVIDTSRNGAGPPPDGDWCNPPGRALGVRPTVDTGHRHVDAYLWIKPPGESDGPCRGGPPAGDWWPEYALELARHGPRNSNLRPPS